MTTSSIRAGGTFPEGFLWGASTASYQIEGGAREDGRGESIWDRFCRVPGNVANGENGDVACDHFHRWSEDVDLMASLGLKGYRFSIAWPRLFPSGGGRLNRQGLDFYDRLVDRLAARGIAPAATLYHWDLPQALQERGGWRSRDTAYRFADYAAEVSRALGDRVRLWMTHNEPWCSSFLGHYHGVHAPGQKSLAGAMEAAHHMLLSHGLAVRALRSSGRGGRAGIALNLFPTYPMTQSEADRQAARLSDGYTNRWFLDPIFRGRYPQDTFELFSRLAGPVGAIRPEDGETIAAPIDFLGVNYYHRRVIEAAPGAEMGWKVHDRLPGVPTTDLDTEINPPCLVDVLERVQRDYAPKAIVITENGAAFDDVLEADGQVRDTRRVDYLRGHFRAARDALARGVALEGYFVWSLMDNFEWAFGYAKRFGLVYVDYASQRRIPKDSARYLAQVIRENRVD